MKILCAHCQTWCSYELSIECDCGVYCRSACQDLAHDKMQSIKFHIDALAALGCAVNIKGLDAHEFDIRSPYLPPPETLPDEPIPYVPTTRDPLTDFIRETDAIGTPRKTNESN